MLLLGLLCACNAIVPPLDKTLSDKPEPPEAAPRFERRVPGNHAPSFAEFRGNLSQLEDVVTCRSCHEDVAAHWALSAHARSSFDNPWYRASVAAFREARGEEASRFCAGCHDPVLLSQNAIDEDVDPADPRAHAGITCLVCHSATRATSDGNGSYSLLLNDVPIPDPDDEEQVAAHVARLTPEPLRSGALCGACHRSFAGPDMGSPHFLAGIDDLGAFGTSAFSGAEAERPDEVDASTCISCHMQPRDAPADLAASEGMVSSHQVAASHTVLPGADHDLVGAASIDVAAAEVDGDWYYPANIAPAGRRFRFDVVVRNERAGHRFPGGTRDLQDTWIEVEVLNDGEVLAQAGSAHAEEADESAYRFRSVLLDEEGRPEEDHLVHRFVSPAFDRTVAPRDAVVVRYELAARSVITPRVRVRLWHRKHSAGLRALACDAHQSREGQAYAAASRRLGREVIDPCTPEPITLIGEAEVQLGETSAQLEHAYERLRNLVLARSKSLQERLEEAREVVEVARAFERDGSSELDVLLAIIAGRQGRVDEALELLEGDDSTAAARARGRALAQVWRWEEAAIEFEKVARAHPRDSVAWTEYARALGSAGDSEGAQDAAERGLALAPRSESLLRSLALATGSEEIQHEYLAHRRPDEAPRLLRRCEDLDAVCARDRQPIATIQLR